MVVCTNCSRGGDGYYKYSSLLALESNRRSILARVSTLRAVCLTFSRRKRGKLPVALEISDTFGEVDLQPSDSRLGMSRCYLSRVLFFSWGFAVGETL